MSVKGNTQILEEADHDGNIQAFKAMIAPLAKAFPLGLLFFFFGSIPNMIAFVAVFWLTYYLCSWGSPKKRRRKTKRRR